MPELADDDPRMQKFSKSLTEVMRQFVGKTLDRSTIMQINDAIIEHRIRFKYNYGCDAPVMVSLVLPTSSYVGLFRADLETTQIQIVILNLLREMAVRRMRVDKRELAWAIRMAWPDYDPAIEFFSNDRQAGKAFLH
jgi:hypothetical protein